MNTAPGQTHWPDDSTIEQQLERFLPNHQDHRAQLCAAMRHAVLGGGKRFRPKLVYAAANMLGLSHSDVHQAAVAVEYVHAYSLIHDDLPCMDDDDLRRGKPTVHKAFDEATAVLAGDALQCLAFDVLAQSALSNDVKMQQIQQLASASGASGMAGGQAIDLALIEQTDISHATLQTMHAHKTGALIAAAIHLGAAPAQPDPITQTALDAFGAMLGLAFQIRDDILDASASSETLGKTAGKDADNNKPTYVTILGIEQANQQLLEAAQAARQALAPFGAQANGLLSLLKMTVKRTN